MEDQEIMDLYFDRDERAISETAQKYGRLCHKIAYQITGSDEDAEECVNDTYHGIWQAIPPKRPDCFRAFAAKIARNIAIGRLKYNTAAKRNADIVISLSELEEVIPHMVGVEEASDQEVGKWISDFLYSEKEETRNIFLRKYWFFDSISDIARQFGHSEAKIKSILFRTRCHLKNYLKEKGVAI